MAFSGMNRYICELIGTFFLVFAGTPLESGDGVSPECGRAPEAHRRHFRIFEWKYTLHFLRKKVYAKKIREAHFLASPIRLTETGRP